MAEQVDAVTGATFSSRAIIENVHRGLAYAKQHAALDNASGAADSADVQADAYLAKGWTIGGVAALIVVLLGAVVPLLFNNRRWHNVQLVLNVVVLGLWTGTFVSYTLLMRLFAGGVSIASLGVLAAPLLTIWWQCFILWLANPVIIALISARSVRLRNLPENFHVANFTLRRG